MTKTISLSDEAYEALAGLRGGNESFSDVALRMVLERQERILLDPRRKPVFTKQQAKRLIDLTYAARDES